MELRKGVNLAPYTTLKIGGLARYFCEAKSINDLIEALTFSETEKIPVTIIGGGSNILIDDNGIDGLVIKVLIKGISYEEKETETLISVGAGVGWDDFVLDTVNKGYRGLENLSGIPGLVGASPIQNINAYGTTVGDYIKEVVTVDKRTKREKIFSRDNCLFAYRDSYFKTEEGKNFFITKVVFSLSKNKLLRIDYLSSSQSIKMELERQGIKDPGGMDIREAVLNIRRNIGMLEGQYQSAGSFFKNVILEAEHFFALEKIVAEKFKEKSDRLSPWHWRNQDGNEKVSAAFLIECTPYNKVDCSNKLFNSTVSVSPLHSLSVINKGGAKSNDVKEFADLIIKTVRDNFGVNLEPEVCFLG